MYARIASVSKPILFKPIEVELAESTSEKIKATLEATNEFIAFINGFRFRKENPNYTDVERRERIAYQLQNKAHLESLQKKVFPYWFCNHMPADKAREKEKELQLFFEELSGYARFVHLTAAELAVVTIAIQKLIIFLQYSQKEIQDVVIQEHIRNKLNELIESQAVLFACMLKHLDVFNKNLPDKDILLSVIDSINSLTGASRADWPAIETDKSLLDPIPDLPFGDNDETRTARHLFETCQAARSNPSQWVLNTAGTVIDKAGEWTGWCLQGAWWMTSSLVTAPLKLAGGGAKLATKTVQGVVEVTNAHVLPVLSSVANKIDQQFETKVVVNTVEEEPEQINQEQVLTNDLHQYVEKMTKFVTREFDTFQQTQELNEWKEKIRLAIQRLEKEVEKISIFRFFAHGMMELKTHKVLALSALLAAQSMERLKVIAGEQMNGKDKESVLAGRASRTKALLEEVAASVAQRSERRLSS